MPDEIGRCVIGPYARRSMLCAVGAALLLAYGCGDSGGNQGTSVTLPPLPTTTATTTTPSSTSTTRGVASTTPPAPTTVPTTAPTTTRVRATDATAQAFFEGWVANDPAKMAANGEAAAITQANAILASRARPWNFDHCEGAAGSIYCSWLDAGQRLIIRVRNVEPPPRAVIEIRIETA